MIPARSYRNLLFAFLAVASTTKIVVKATYSIAAVDLKNELIGGASATCILSNRLSLFEALYRVVKGKGVLLTQAVVQTERSPAVVLGRELIDKGTDPQEVLDAIADPQVDRGSTSSFRNANLRQYGLVDFDGRAATYTGPSIENYYAKVGFDPSVQEGFVAKSDNGSFVHSAQGNIVAEGTVPAVSKAFNEGCDLPQRLFNALVSVQGDENKFFLGDIRCRDLGIAGSMAFLHVEDKTGNVLFSMDVKYQAGVDPLDTIRDRFMEWREDNPCHTQEPNPTGSATETHDPTKQESRAEL